MLRTAYAPSFLTQLRALCDAHPTALKVVFVPRMQLGQAMETAAARRSGSWGGLTCCLPTHFARKIARWDVLHSDRSEWPSEGTRLLVSAILDDLAGSSLMRGLPGPRHFAAATSEAVETLRHNGVAPEAVRARAESRHASRTFRVTAACYEKYIEHLDSEALYDQADVMRWATRRVQEAPGTVADAVFAVCDETELPVLEYEWLQALRAHGEAFYRLGVKEHETAPPEVGASLFAGAALPQQVITDERTGADSINAYRSVGAENEVRGVLREIIRSGAPLDEVEIAYAASKPYLSLIYDCARQAGKKGIAVTLGTGLPALQSRTGQALRGYYEWIMQDFDVKILIRLLRSGLVRVDRGQEEGAPAPHEIATILAGHNYEPGRRGIDKAFRFALEDSKSGSEQHRATQQTHESTRSLMSLIPAHTSAQRFAEAGITFLERYGPVDPAGDEEESREFEEAARASLYEKLENITRLPFRYEADAPALATAFGKILEAQYAPPQRPRPGAAHVVPLEGAGYTGREHLFVVGMDNESLSHATVDDVMLRDADRSALSANLNGTISAGHGAGEAAAWRIERAFRRHQGPLSLYCNVFDPATNKDCFPSALFLEMESVESDGGAALGFAPDGEFALDERDIWLRAYAAARKGSSGSAGDSPHTARDVIADRFPWIIAGERARQSIESDSYTPHDGMLVSGPYPMLDFTDPNYDGPPMSAGRLETLAETPYLYFLKYVLRIKPLDEPALEDAAWLDPLRRGSLLHNVFEAFMRRINGRSVTLDDEALLMEVLEEEIANEKSRIAPRNERIEDAARRSLQADALVFLYAEAEAAGSATPLYHEIGFGNPSRYSREGDLGTVSLVASDTVRMPLRGRIDRVDRLEDGALAVWDYKTGSGKDYGVGDPLRKGALLQWALYAYALNAATGERVGRSGYFFANTGERGMRIADAPDEYREKVNEMILQMGKLARNGCFPMNPDAQKIDSWKYKGYAPAFFNLAERSSQLKAKKDGYPQDSPRPLFFK